jgi:hypothetical protein
MRIGDYSDELPWRLGNPGKFISPFYSDHNRPSFGMVALGYEKYHDGAQAEFNEDPLRHLYNVYVQVTQDA